MAPAIHLIAAYTVLHKTARCVPEAGCLSAVAAPVADPHSICAVQLFQGGVQPRMCRRELAQVDKLALGRLHLLIRPLRAAVHARDGIARPPLALLPGVEASGVDVVAARLRTGPGSCMIMRQTRQHATS